MTFKLSLALILLAAAAAPLVEAASSNNTSSLSLLTPSSPSFLSSISTASLSADVYPIQWTTVSQIPSLNAIEVTVAGACQCDVTLNGCDVNCCCDLECDQSAKALFSECGPEGPSPPSLDYCLPKSQVAKVNLHHSSSFAVVETTAPDAGFLSKQLCIAQENNAELGQFFSDPVPAVETDLATAVSAYGEFTFGKSAAAATTTFNVNTFRVGDTIPAAYVISAGGALVPTGAGSVFTLPAAALSASCDGLQTVGFMVDVVESSCERYNLALAQDCSTAFDADRYTGWLRIGQTGAAVQSQPSGYVSVTVGTVRFRDASNGQLTSLAGSLPSAYDVASGTCTNSLSKVSYTVAYDGAGLIVSVTADLVLTNTTADAVTGFASLQQTFGVKWVRDGTQSKVRPKSGNPGYLEGLPVLAGQIASSAGGSKKAIAQFTDGLPILSADTDGSCSPAYVSNVLFGADMVTSCRVSLNQAQLAAFCQSTPPAPPPIQLLGGLFGALSNDTYVATWASADASNVLDWHKVTVEGMTSLMTWDASLLTCRGVAAGLKYEFLVSKVGARDNPQRQISFGRVSLAYSDWTFQDAAQPAVPQNFVVQSTVNFLPRVQEEARPVGQPPPPLLPSLPDDLFYPFFISSGAVTVPGSGYLLLFGCFLTLYAVLPV